MTELLQTPLHAMHLAAGAKMVPFAGYDMPVQYPDGIKTEHLHTRDAAGLFDVSHMGQAVLSGPQVRADLEKLLPLDLDLLQPGQQVYTFLPNADGGIVDDLIVTCWDDATYFVVFNAGCKAKDEAHFRAHLSADTTLELLDDRALLALQGPKAVEVLAALAPEVQQLVFMTGKHVSLVGAECFVTRSGYTGEDGFEISVPATAAGQLAEALMQSPLVKWIGLGARDSLRLEAGLCLYSHDMNDDTSPVAASLMWAVAKSRRVGGSKEGGFIGAEKIFAVQKNGVAEMRVGFLIDGKAPVREDADIVDEDGEVIGRVTSGGFSPSLNAPIAMGYVKAGYAILGTPVAAMVRDKPRPMTVSKMPFVPQRYYRG
ncbi:glycine cleavage system aminomethyltransferase GcvT [Pseudomaricurvus sp. HS19]|uniref:glycine cleavage system aminomethyltransferase GcvT n=1 Tax=Pseudomaricurvus sp. HS19 TaxID=2692626 RepID=UPI00136D0FA3|nr:glycine cleavage system aminomethyltransferase GcvT [Pseudomaricurvus sp. HS19]MYM64781.1 glycine cleavage system aminomethyltransferase GcvT [Pseudomaricurvus sp. HS19]